MKFKKLIQKIKEKTKRKSYSHLYYDDKKDCCKHCCYFDELHPKWHYDDCFYGYCFYWEFDCEYDYCCHRFREH